MPRKEKVTIEEVKLKLWKHCFEAGFEIGPLNCLYSKAPQTGDRIRLNFRDQKVLKLEVKRPLTDEEKKEAPDKTSRWDVMESGAYEKVEIGESGELIFDKKKKAEKEKPKAKKKEKPEAEGKESE